MTPAELFCLARGFHNFIRHGVGVGTGCNQTLWCDHVTCTSCGFRQAAEPARYPCGESMAADAPGPGMSAGYDQVARGAPTADDLAFLAALEQKCHFTVETRPDWYGETKLRDAYHRVKLTADDIGRLCGIVVRCELFVLPTTTAFGFSPAFVVVQPEKTYPCVPTSLLQLAKFEERQLPPGWSFDRLADTCFPSERQVQFYGLRLCRDRDAYDY